MNNENKIGKLIRKYRTEAGLTQAELAEKLEHISRTALASYETGQAVPPYDKLAEISDALKLDYWCIFGLDANRPKENKRVNHIIEWLNYLGYGLSGSGLYGSPVELSAILFDNFENYTFEIMGNGKQFVVSGKDLIEMFDISMGVFELMLNKKIEAQKDGTEN